MKRVVKILGIAAVVVIGCVGIGLINDDIIDKEDVEGTVLSGDDFKNVEIVHLPEDAFIADAAEKEKRYYDYLEGRLEKLLESLDNVSDMTVDICMEEDTDSEGSVLVKYECKNPVSDEELQQWEDFIHVQLGNEQIAVCFEQN